VQRLKTLQQKKEAQAKASRREIATLLERGKEETAKIKVEALIHEDIYTELLELLELYCELLLARFGLLDQNTQEPDPGISEGVCTVIHAAPRTELKELHILREILMYKYGRDFAIAAIENRNNCVSERVIRKLVTNTPAPELVDAYLVEIAKGYGIHWALDKLSGSDKAIEDTVESLDASEGGGPSATDATPQKSEDQNKPKVSMSGSKFSVVTDQNSPAATKEDDFSTLLRRFNELKER